jgi:sugar phosphate isomerase/epimerase
MRLSRRSFVEGLGAGSLLAAANRTGLAEPLGLPIGFQGYDCRFLLMDDWDKGWATMRAMGYQSVDMVSFKGYGYEKSSLGQLSGRQVREKLDAVGILCDNCQFYFGELHEGYERTIRFCHELEIKYVICAPDGPHTKTIDGWKWHGEKLNELAARLKVEGLLLGYHNHDLEFTDIDGVTPYDVLMQRTEPTMVWFQVDVGNLTFAGKDALAYLKKYEPRYFSMHAKDYRPGLTSVPVGKGILDWRRIFEQAKKSPLKSYFAEVAAYGVGTMHGLAADRWPTDSIDQLRESFTYLKNLNI